MIIEALLNLLYKFLQLLLTPLSIPDLPDGIEDALNSVKDWIAQGLSVVAAFCHFDFISSLFAAVLVIESAMLVYKFIRWILQKIPAAGVE